MSGEDYLTKEIKRKERDTERHDSKIRAMESGKLSTRDGPMADTTSASLEQSKRQKAEAEQAAKQLRAKLSGPQEHE